MAGRSRPAVMAVLASVVMVAGCAMTARPKVASPSTTARSEATTVTASTTTTTAPTGYVPPVTWSACGDDLQCGSVSVPLDYSRPDGRMIAIALERRPAGDPSQRIGSLVINPGGPGTSGIDDLPNELSVLTPELLDRFDIVSFDPRGVERSAPVSCSAPAPAPASTTTTTTTTPPVPTPVALPNPVPTGLAAEKATQAADKAYAEACQKYSKGVLAYVGTVDAARDLDRIRAALGDATLTYIGHSYGTLLGATYAGMYPDHVRAMVLDGAIDPALSSDQMVLDQAQGFESVLDDFFRWCASTASCRWRPSGDPTAALVALIAASGQKGIPGRDGGTAGPGEFYNALLDNLYSRSSWPDLGNALADAAAGDGTDLITSSTSYASGGSTNGGDANNAINCLDHPVAKELSSYQTLATTAAAEAPVFGPVLAWGLLQCSVWPVPPTRTPGPITAAGAPPILVTGTTGDPATPYQWAVSWPTSCRRASSSPGTGSTTWPTSTAPVSGPSIRPTWWRGPCRPRGPSAAIERPAREEPGRHSRGLRGEEPEGDGWMSDRGGEGAPDGGRRWTGTERGNCSARHRVGFAAGSFPWWPSSSWWPGAAACSSSSAPGAAPSQRPIPAPRGLPAFYAVPQPLPPGPAGTLVKPPVKVAVSGLNGTVYRVMYKSESVTNKPVVVTGLIIVPDTPPPVGGYPVVTWGHGTNGMADQCAPSLDPLGRAHDQRPPRSGVGSDGQRLPGGRDAGILPTSWG